MMDFKSWMEKHESQHNLVEEENENQIDASAESKPKRVYKRRDTGVASGADIARELGVSRAHIKQITNRAISKIYASVKALNISDLNSPLQIVIQMAMMFGILDNQQGLRDLVNNLSKEQKKELFDDIKNNYPEYAKIMKVKI